MPILPDASAVGHRRKSSAGDRADGARVEFPGVYPAAAPVRDSKRPHGPGTVAPPPTLPPALPPTLAPAAAPYPARPRFGTAPARYVR